MATRPPRLKRPHTYFHVTTRGTNRWNIFLDDADRHRFMALLAIVCKRYSIEVHAYCLMGNHLHLVLYCPEPVLSDAMRDLKSRYATYFNRRHNGTGPVFEGPFVEVPILDDEHLMTEIRYSHRNPLDLDPNVCLATCEWSSHGIYLGLRPQPSFVQTRIGSELFGPGYQHAVENPTPRDKVQNVAGRIVDTPGVSTIGVAEDRSLATVLSEVAHAAGCEISEIRPRAHNGLVGIAVLVATEHCGFTAAEAAEPFGFKSRGAAHAAAQRAKRRLMSDSHLHALHHAVVQRLKTAA